MVAPPVVPGGPAAPEVVPPAPPVPGGTKKTTSVTPERGQLVVELPAGAKLFVDGNLMKSNVAKRTFSTPPLDPGQAYFYMLRAEVERDGQTLSETTRVIVRAGETARASFPSLQGTETATARR
jgi:uncharacterized protein (TIGR03000 family)